MQTDEIDKAQAMARDGLLAYPHDTVFQHASLQLSKLKSFLVDKDVGEASILAEFDLGLMAARELGNEDREFADVLHRIQRQVESLR